MQNELNLSSMSAMNIKISAKRILNVDHKLDTHSLHGSAVRPEFSDNLKFN